MVEMVKCGGVADSCLKDAISRVFLRLNAFTSESKDTKEWMKGKRGGSTNKTKWWNLPSGRNSHMAKDRRCLWGPGLNKVELRLCFNVGLEQFCYSQWFFVFRCVGLLVNGNSSHRVTEWINRRQLLQDEQVRRRTMEEERTLMPTVVVRFAISLNSSIRHKSSSALLVTASIHCSIRWLLQRETTKLLHKWTVQG